MQVLTKPADILKQLVFRGERLMIFKVVYQILLAMLAQEVELDVVR